MQRSDADLRTRPGERLDVHVVRFREALDSRDVLIWYQWLSFAAGLIIVLWRWPMPAAFSARPLDPPAVWSVILTGSAAALWLSGLTALGLSRIEDPAVRTRALRWLGYTIMLVPLIVSSNGFGIADRLPEIFLWLPLIIGIALTSLTLRPPAAVPAPPVPSLGHSMVVRDKQSLRGRFEQSIRQAARQEERDPAGA